MNDPNEENNFSDLELTPDEESMGEEVKNKIRKAKNELKQCEAEKKEYLDGWQRAKADFINYKKDEAKRFESMAEFLTAGIMGDIIPVLDSFDLALKHELPKETERGFTLIRSQLEDILKKSGITAIKVNLGDQFNTSLHESVGEIESDFPEEAVAEIIQKGYLFGEKVLRPARVKISKKGE